MRNPNTLSLIVVVIVNLLFASNISNAFGQFKISENNFPGQTGIKNPNRLQDSLPEKVKKDWINKLRDENGNRIKNENELRKIPEEPGTDAFQRNIFNGLIPGAGLGVSVSSAGDVNGDGFDDIIAGAFVYNSATGRAYIYFGGTNMNTIADVVLTGEAASNYFGNSVSSAGDVNGDGYDDVLVGAYGYNTNTGRAYIYYGGALMNNIPDVTMTGGATGNLFGFSVSSAGDVNGDGYSDAIVGASGYSTGTGRAYVFYGGSSMNNVVDVTMTGGAASDFLGYSVSTAGDVNGDGFADVIAGAYGYSSSTGRAYIFMGGSVMDNVADVTFTGEAVNNDFGYSVSSAGDANGDGYSDVVVGAFGYSSSTGRVYVYYGSSPMNNAADVIITGTPGSSSFGSSVASAGDINGDGYPEVIVGDYGFNTFTGKIYIYFGGAPMNNVVDATLSGEGTGNSFGRSVASAGDVNGDGYADILSGANGYSANSGRVYLYDYFMKGVLTQELTMTGEAANNYYGSVSSAGDVNGDGYSDVVVGASYYSTSTGRAYIYFGGPLMDNIADVVLTGSAGINFAASVTSAGDVNGDGYGDVIAGARNYSSSTGRAYIFFGGVSMDNIPDVTMTGGAANDYFGNAVSSAGDVNGDGYSDVVVGAYGYNTFTGRAYVFLGGSSMNNTADVTMTGEATNNSFGGVLSSAGDLNDDGYSDIIIGAYAYSTYTGRVYIFFGGSSMNNQKDLTYTGDNTGDYFGVSVSTAGDVNGDGYSDVIIGSSGFNSSTGKAIIVFGGIIMDGYPDVFLSGETSTSFGGAVSSAGDVNGDGYSDVIVGGYGYNSSLGKAYIFYGGTPMNSAPDASMIGESGIDEFGASVSSAGDLNRDGYSDVIVGSYYNNLSTGKAYIFNGSAISVKPILVHAKDVPNDQGGKLNLKWSKSSYDANGTTLVTNYLVQRSFPPSGGNYSWENIAEIPATHESFYSYTDETPSDSSSSGNNTFYYRITARTNSINQYWRSNTLSGRSLDNIAPLMVSPFTATKVSTHVRLDWTASASSDLLNYVLYRSTLPTIDPHTQPVFATTTDLTYLDTSPLTGSYYYFIVAQDIHNNKSPVAVVSSPGVVLNLSMYVQGFYNSASDIMVSDTVRIYLRNASTPYSIIDSSKAKINSSGQGTFTFTNAVNGVNYFLQLKHRNSVETWSKTVQQFTSSALAYNFTNAATQAFGNNMPQIDASPLRFGIYSGDQNQDGFVNLSDIINVYNGSTAFANGYVPTDMNGDNLTNLTDILITYNNAGAFVKKIVP